MGLDLLVSGRAKPGHEAEWRRLVERSFKNVQLTEKEEARVDEISVAPYEQVGAPRVGQDPAADAWILKTRGAKTPDEIAQVLKEFDGYYALALVECDGLPKFTHANLYDGVDDTSFRGAFFKSCGDVLSDDLIDAAWEHKMPEAAVEYGRALLEAADAAHAKGPPPPPPLSAPPAKRGFLARLFKSGPPKKVRTEPFEFQLDIVRCAGKWFVFWGERGNAIQAWS